MQMKSSVFKLLMAAFALFAAFDADAVTLSDSILCDTSTHYGHYDHRVHRYRQRWSNLIPTQHVLQFAGNMGLASIGVGWDYGKRRQWETHLLFGYIPKYDSKRAKLTMTLKENYIPWSIYLDDGWNLEPLECGLLSLLHQVSS